MNDNTFDVWRLPNGHVVTQFTTMSGKQRYEEHIPLPDRTMANGYNAVKFRDDFPVEAIRLTPESEGLEPLLATNRKLHERIESEKGEREIWHRAALSLEADIGALRGELAEAKRAKSVFGENLDAASARAKSNQAALREALTLIAKDGCENVTTASGCIGDTDRKRGAPYTAESWCFPCVAKDALSAATSTPPTLPDRMRAAADVLEEADAQKYGDDKVGSWTAAGLRINANAFEVEDRERAETEQLVEDVAELIFGAEWEGRPGHQWTEARARLNDFNAKFTIARKATS